MMTNHTNPSGKTQLHTPESVPETKAFPLRALALILVLLALCTLSVLCIFYRHQAASSGHACIYQNGSLIQTIDLSKVTEPYSFTITSSDGGFNTIEVRPGAIGICDADCPDRLCVSMGYADSSLLPVICLPHSLVIQIKENKENIPDSITY